MARDGTVGVLDFQDARMGPQPYDLASLLTDRGTPDLLGGALLTALTDYYLQRMQAEVGQRIDRDAFDQLFALLVHITEGGRDKHKRGCLG